MGDGRRRGQTTPNVKLSAPSVGFVGSALSPQAAAALNQNSYGRFYVSAPIGSGWNPPVLSLLEGDCPGTYHLVGRVQTSQTPANLPNVSVRPIVEQRLQARYGDYTGLTDQVSDY